MVLQVAEILTFSAVRGILKKLLRNFDGKMLDGKKSLKTYIVLFLTEMNYIIFIAIMKLIIFLIMKLMDNDRHDNNTKETKIKQNKTKKHIKKME